ncbi:hypothetical protein M0802_007533 [Mischocyttarus mexicanus]|nr:hypothetical protein M0802_007533 [Mischocyttarus mexicanus]
MGGGIVWKVGGLGEGMDGEGGLVSEKEKHRNEKKRREGWRKSLWKGGSTQFIKKESTARNLRLLLTLGCRNLYWPLHMYSREPMGSLVTLGGHLRVVLHSQDDATVAAESTDPPSSLANEHI